jgi:nucleotide-binding universal stress UspA family protein
MSKPTASPFARMLLATDGSPNSQQAAEVAAQIAKSFNSEVTVLCAIPSIGGRGAPLEGEYYSRLVNKADDNADRAASVFKKVGVAVSEREVPQDRASVVETIVEYAAQQKTGLIVMGTRGLGGFKRAAMGSVSSGVSAHAPCATLVVRPRGKNEEAGLVIKRVLAAVDSSQNAQSALEAAVELAKGVKAELRVAHVVYIPTLFWSMGVPGSAIPTDKIEEDAEASARELLAKAVKFAKDSGVETVKDELVTDLVSPYQGIVQLAERDDADVIVIGTRGNGGFKKLLLGSVANSVLHYAGCSVLVTKETWLDSH